ncbi:hypothetical protein AB2L28_15510 [Kineococcus sp. TBRC 1896]|uniref:Uncharacterized protein n=1 Tax=Kineococcus mangrovi TaxID=1660183 RepID=A0ABV4I8P8_9ACTN
MSEEAQSPLPREVVDGLQALVAGEELTDTLRPSSRAPGSLAYSWAPVTEVRLRLLTGFPVPRLSPRGVAGRQEVLAVPGRNGEPSFEVDEQGSPSTSAFAVFHLPHDLDWRRAAVSSVLEQEVTCLYVQLPPDERPWPQSVAHRRHRFDADGGLRPVSGDDFTVVDVDGCSVGVQIDRSGAVCVGWSIGRSSGGTARVWNVTMLTRGSAVQAVQVVREAGLLR